MKKADTQCETHAQMPWTAASPSSSPSRACIPSSPDACALPTKTRGEVLATRALWLVIVLIHAMCSGYYALAAVVYHELPSTLLWSHMRAFRLAIDMKSTPVVAAFFAVSAALHTAFLLEMAVVSACRRELVFRSQYTVDPAALGRRLKALRKAASARVLAIGSAAGAAPTARDLQDSTTTRELLRRAEGAASSAWKQSFGITGVFGVGGKHFAMLFLVREALEATLQSIQAYYLSKYVPRMWLNRSAVALVAVSCWSTPTIRLLTTRSRRAELMLCLLVDIALDVASSVGIPLALGAVYSRNYDPVITTFKRVQWGDATWAANLNSEFKQLFIQNWFDFATRALFAIATLLSLDDVKLLAVPSAHVAMSFSRRDPVTVQPNRKRFEKLVHALLMAWGVAILALHIDSVSAKTSVDVTGCLVRVHPWLAATATCAALKIDCKQRAGMVGTAEELESSWSRLDASALSSLMVHNCPELRIPASIQSFTGLANAHIQGSSLIEWSASAALTKHHHPNLRQIGLIAVNMTAASIKSDANASEIISSLPPGLLSRDFPPTLGVVFAAAIALDHLPSDLHEIWPRGLNLLLIACKLTDVPDAILRLEPAGVNVQANRITHLRRQVLELPSLQWLEVGSNPLSELPEDVSPSPALVGFEISGTNVSVLPSWMTTESFKSRVRVKASGTPFCARLANDSSAPRETVTQYCTQLAL